MDINSRVNNLRKVMRDKEIDAYIILTGDPHQSEYIPEYYKSRQWMSGFTGSAGTIVITNDEALFWTDGRYHIQAENELSNTEYELFKMGLSGVLDYDDWLSENLEENDVVGFDGRTFSQLSFEKLEEKLSFKNINYKTDEDLIQRVWEDRGEFPNSKAFIHEINYSGLESRDKIIRVRKAMKELGADYHVIGKLDDIAWLFNIRGFDIPSNPMLLSYGIITRDDAILFVYEQKIDEEVKSYLKKQGIRVKSYEDIKEYLEGLPDNCKILLDKENLNKWVYDSIPKSCKIINKMNPSFKFKAVKSSVELKNQKNAYIKDGVAVTKFLYWLEKNKDNNINEFVASKKLYEFRSQQENFIGTSFKTIMAYKENAAMMHYRPTESVSKVLEDEGLLLIDSGGQYLDGTTDITRTISMGETTDEEKRDYTLTLKSHIALIDARFLYGTSGHVLDSFARRPMWDEGMDYKSGTGHGVGYFLNVHEGPHRFHNIVVNNVALEENMIITIEPGVYKKDRHGIRIENVAVVKKDIETEFGQFMKFEPLTFVYIETDTLNLNMLTDKELEWLNKYNEKVFDKISKFLNEDEKNG